MSITPSPVSLAKAFVGHAGVIACGSGLADFFAFEALPAIFSSALLPHELAGLRTTLDVNRAADGRRCGMRGVTQCSRWVVRVAGDPRGALPRAPWQRRMWRPTTPNHRHWSLRVAPPARPACTIHAHSGCQRRDHPVE